MVIKRLLLGSLVFLAAAYAYQSYTPVLSNAAATPGQGGPHLKGAASKPVATEVGPAFEDYPVSIATGPFVAPKFNKTAGRYHKYRTAISLAARTGPNFAGRYTIVEVGCGTACTIPFIVDGSNGEVSEFPREIGVVPDFSYAYRPESRLLVALWSLDQLTDKPRCRKIYYLRTASNFVKIDENIAPGECHS